MNENFLYKGNLLDIIKSNSTSSIKGVLNPHEISLSNFLFLDYDFESFKKLFQYYNKDEYSEYDQLPFYYGLCYIALKDRLACLLGQHGMISLGKTLKQALFLGCEVLLLGRWIF